MYLQITSRCNMRCPHCGFSCTKDGEDMSLETFKQALDSGYGTHLSIGGGEPTLHPDFEKMIFLALGHPYVESVWLATNGSNTELSLALAKLTRKEVLTCELSQDQWHDPIDDYVVKAFDNLKSNTGYKFGVRSVSSLVPVGRAKQLIESGVYTGKVDYDTCLCPGPLILPNGDVKICGCEDSPVVGNVKDKSLEIPHCGCFKEMEEVA